MPVPAPAARPARQPRSRLAAVLADPRRVLLVAAVLVGFAACVDVLHDPDLWWHLRLGRWILDHGQVPHAELFSFTARGNHMVAHEWGSEILFNALSGLGGLLLVAVVMGLVAWSGLVALALRARARGAGAVAVAVAVLLGARAMEPVLGTRPQVITVALVCWTLLVAERHVHPRADARPLGGPPPTPSAAAGVRPADSVPPGQGGRWIWVLPPIGLGWANLHGAVVLGLAALAAVAGLEAVRRLLPRLAGPGAVAPWRRIGSLGLATALMAAVGCLNPNGPGLYRYVIETSGSERAKPITEWHAPDFHDPSNLGLLILLVSFPLLVALGGRLNLRDLVMSLGGFAAALLAVRNTSLAVALALPAWALMLQQVLDRRRGTRASAGSRRPARTVQRPAVMFGGVIVALALAVDGMVVARAAQDASPGGIASVYPACAAQTLRSTSGVRIVASYYVSGYLIEQLWPEGRVFLYGESASLGQRVFDDYERILAGGPRALAVLSSYGANAVLIGPGALHDALASSTDWRAVHTWPVDGTLFAHPDLAVTLHAASC